MPNVRRATAKHVICERRCTVELQRTYVRTRRASIDTTSSDSPVDQFLRVPYRSIFTTWIRSGPSSSHILLYSYSYIVGTRDISQYNIIVDTEIGNSSVVVQLLNKLHREIN
ncbi:hypothetical protein QTP88_003025 [Uroleucon formosanum]